MVGYRIEINAADFGCIGNFGRGGSRYSKGETF